MKIHIFNPEHDLVLASDAKCYTPSEGIRKMKNNLSYLPVFWADDEDVILVDDVEAAIQGNAADGINRDNIKFITTAEIKDYPITEVDPWGWDKALKHSLIRYGIDASLLPTDSQLKIIRNMSHRHGVIPMLQVLRDGLEEYTCGDALECTSLEDVREALSTWRSIVVKAPWSSSGINIIYIEEVITTALESRICRLISKQGSVMAEPLYNKVKDFAMEFYSDGTGNIDYAGLSVFDTVGTAYLNNLITSEEEKRSIITEYISADILDEINRRIVSYMSVICRQRYKGPFGVDMMIVKQNGHYMADPCVEINLRRTMGHVAIARYEASR